MSIDSVNPATLHGIVVDSGVLHILVFGEATVPRAVAGEIARVHGGVPRICHVSDRFDADNALWRAEPGDKVLLVGTVEVLGEGVSAALDRGLSGADIVVQPTEDAAVLCLRCEIPSKGSGPACIRCDLSLPPRGVAPEV